MNEILTIIYLALEIGAMIYMLHGLFGSVVKCEIITLSLIVIDVLFLYVIENIEIGHECSVLIYIVIFIYCIIKFKTDYTSIFVNYLLCFLIVSILQFIYALVFSLLIDSDKNWILYCLLLNVALFISSYFIYRKKLAHKISEVFLHNNILIAATLLFGIVILINCIYQVKISENAIVYNIIVCFMVVLLLLMMAMSLGKSIIKNKQLETAMQIQNTYSESFEGMISAIRLRQHEFDNHLHTLAGMWVSHTTYDCLVKAQNEYMQDLLGENRHNKLLKIGNPTLAGFLYSKFSNIDENKVDLNYMVSCNKAESKVPIYIIVELLGNLLDNAIEEISIQEGIKKLYFVAEENAEQIVFEVRNEHKYISHDVIESFFIKGNSSKSSDRGYGLYHVKKLCEDYGISLICENIQVDSINFFMVKLVILKNVPSRY